MTKAGFAPYLNLEISNADKLDAARQYIKTNEILTARNVPEQFILAVVKVDGDEAHTTYYGNLKFKEPDHGMAYITYNIGKLRDMGDVIYVG